jgi:hypothetical protein
MNKIEKRLSVAAFVFVGIYIGALFQSFHSRSAQPSEELRIEASSGDEATRHIMLAEFLLPMLVLFTLTICFVAVRKKQQRTLQRLEEYEMENLSETNFEFSASEPETDKNSIDSIG